MFFFKSNINKFLSSFTTYYSNEAVDHLSLIYTFYYFSNSKVYIKDFINPEHFSNRYKIASCTTMTILSLQLMFDKKGAHKEANVKFAIYMSLIILFSFEKNIFDIFNSYLDTNVGIVNDKFDNIQEHHLFYLRNVKLIDGQHLPIMLYALFLQSLIQWLEFKEINSNLGLQL